MANKAVELDPLGHVVLDHLEDSNGYSLTFVVTGDEAPYVIAYGYQDDGTWSHGTYFYDFATVSLIWEEWRSKFLRQRSEQWQKSS